MKFIISRTEYTKSAPPTEGAVKTGEDSEGYCDWSLDVGSLRALIALLGRGNPRGAGLILDRDDEGRLTLEIYDGYRE